MKKSFKLLLLFAVFATAFLSGCSEEIYDDHLHEQKQNITTRRIKADELFRDKKVVVELNNVKSFLSSENQLSNQRLVTINGYIIETDDVLLTEYAGIKSYTFPIYEINAEKLKNLVIAEKLDGTYVSKIFEYDLTPSEKIDLENDELKTIQNPVTVLKLTNETVSFGCGFETTIVYIPCSQGVHDSSNLNDWYRCEASVQPSIKVIERLVGCDDGGGGGGSLLNTTGSNPIDYTPVGGTSSLNNNFPNESTNPNDFENGITQPVFTSIDGISEEQLNINLFHNSLNSEQHVWVNENQTNYEQLIQHLIDTNQENNIWSNGSKDFVKWGINYLIANPTTTFEQFQNWFMGTSEGIDGEYDAAYWENPNLTFPAQTLPTWVNFYNAFPLKNGNKYMPAPEVFQLVGGQLYNSHLSNPEAYSNACAIRVSRGLNYSGVTIPEIAGQTEKGADGKNYFLNAKNLNSWMRKTFGIPTGDNHLTGTQGGQYGQNFKPLLSGKKGIYIMIANYPALFATGHADIMNSGVCPGNCHFNPNGGVYYIDFWELQQ